MPAPDMASIRQSPNTLAADYSAFRVEEGARLTGHSHQAWPDCAREGLLECFDDAARHVDDKWDRAFAKANRVAQGFAEWLGEQPGDDAHYALGASTHDLLVRLLSALDLRRRPRIVTTDGEFHSAKRQFQRLAEEGIEVVCVPAWPPCTVGERLAAVTTHTTALVYVSAVFFETSAVAGALQLAAEAAERCGAALVIDTYHALGVMPYPLADRGLAGAFVLGGGYKYMQYGEGNCFLRFPLHWELRPAITGWFASFGTLSERAPDGKLTYGHGAVRFSGATYDPASQYRAARVAGFFRARGLTPSWLQQVNCHQVSRLRDGFLALDLPPSAAKLAWHGPMSETGGFVAIECANAQKTLEALQRNRVHGDVRGNILRLGPAPYISDQQLDDALAALKASVS